MDTVKNWTKEQLLEYIYSLGFCADDMKLYLDIHYNDNKAIDYFNQCNELLKAVREEYESRCEPLLLLERKSGNKWDWNNTNLPWEGDI